MSTSVNLARAHSLLDESKAACDISHLEIVLGILYQAAQVLLPSHPDLAECLNLLATVSLARFSISKDVNDVRKAIGFRCGALGSDINSLIEPNISEGALRAPKSSVPQELLSSAYQLLSEYRRSVDVSKISTAIFLYEKAKAKQDIQDPNRWATQRALADALLLRYRVTGKEKDLHTGTMLLREQHLFESGYLATLCAAVLMKPGPQPLNEVALLLDSAGPNDAITQSLAWEGLGAFAPKLHPSIHSHHPHLSPAAAREDDEEIDDGIFVQPDFGQKHLSSRDLGDMALEMEEQFNQHGQIIMVNEAVRLRRKALESAPRRTRDLLLGNLAATLQTRFEAVGDQKDIDEAVELFRKVLSICTDGHRSRDISLFNLANAIHSRFDSLGNRKDIDEAVELHRKLVDMQPSPHFNRLGCLTSLAVILQTRFDNFGTTDDMMEAIELFRDALVISSPPDSSKSSDRADTLGNLASALVLRFQHNGNIGDLKEAVALHREALSVTPVGDSGRAHALNGLASSLLAQFRISGNPADIEESVKLHRKALALYPSDDPDRGTVLDDLANALLTRYFQGNNPRDINESVDLHRQSLAFYPEPHTSRGGRLHNLAVSLQTRYQNLGDQHDIVEAIELHREALRLCAAPHPDRTKSLTGLADALETLFGETRSQKDIDESIRFHRESVQLQPSVSAANSLANAILSRFGQLRDPEDMDEAVQIYREGLARCPPLSPDRGLYCNRLANALCTGFDQTNDIRQLEEAIDLHREAVAAYSPSHTNQTSAINDLAVAVRKRFHKLHDFKDIEEVIELYRTALTLRSVAHPARAASLSNLANALLDSHGDLEDIEEAMSLHREALELRPAPYADRARWLNGLARCLESAYIHQPDESRYLQQCMTTSKEAATYPSAPPIVRFEYATSWAKIATRYPETQASALEAYQIAINILPQLAAMSLDMQSRHRILVTTTTSAVGAGAAHCAISLGKPELAIEFLEASRSIFWAQALKLRTPLDDLQAAHPKLASKFHRISQDLDKASFRNTEISTKTVLEAEGERCRDLNEQWMQVVELIRSKDGFTDFMRPLGIGTLQKAARLGPVVVISPGESSAHALIIEAKGIQNVPLPLLTARRTKYLTDLTRALVSGARFDFKELKTNRETIDGLPEHRLGGRREFQDPRTKENLLIDLLGTLWDEIASPVISALKLEKGANPKRLWWCLTGPLSFLPIHAAGIKTGELEDCVSNYVVSSYTPTLTTLLHSATNEPLDSFKMTTVIVPDAPNNDYLAGANAELAEINGRVPQEWHTVVGKTTSATVKATIEALRNCSIAHFACHGVQDPVNPLNSGLELSDGRLGITELMQSAASVGYHKNLSLAFLSACETATGDDGTPDEALHFAGAMLFAGFRCVVGTMWRMNDCDGPRVAAGFYERLFDGTSQPHKFPDLAKSAEALHYAVSKLKEDKEVTHLRWVPFVHYGL